MFNFTPCVCAEATHIIDIDVPTSIGASPLNTQLQGIMTHILAQTVIQGRFTIQWNLIIAVTLGPSVAGCYIEVAFLLSGIQNHHN